MMRNCLGINATLVANEFIDRYMAGANGEYVKVYLYLLRHQNEELDIGTIADALNHTESDIRRALGYWGRLGVVSEETGGEASGVSGGVSGATSGGMPGVSTEMTSGGMPGMLARAVAGGAAVGITSDGATGVLDGMSPGRAPGVSAGMTSGGMPGMSAGMTSGGTPGMLAEAVAGGAAVGITSGGATGVSGGVSPGRALGVLAGRISGEVPGVSTGISPGGMPGTSAGMISGSASGGTGGRTQAGMTAGYKPGSGFDLAADAAGKDTLLSSGVKADAREGRKMYTPEEVSRLADQEDFTQLLYISQKYMNKVFTPRECEVFAYLYDALHMSGEVLEYLVEYCVQNGHYSIRYLESVALNWHEKGIVNVNMAKEYTASFSKEGFAVMRAFGINDRRPGESEQKLIDKWFKEYGFTKDIVIEACSRTLAAIHKPSFPYADKILSDWKKGGVRVLADVGKMDEKRAREGKKGNKNAAAVKPAKNQFHNFEQRGTNYDAMVLERLKERLGEQNG